MTLCNQDGSSMLFPASFLGFQLLKVAKQGKSPPENHKDPLKNGAKTSRLEAQKTIQGDFSRGQVD